MHTKIGVRAFACAVLAAALTVSSVAAAHAADGFGEISGRIVDLSGVPVAGAVVEFTTTAPDGTLGASVGFGEGAVTGADGTYRLTDVEPGTVWAFVDYGQPSLISAGHSYLDRFWYSNPLDPRGYLHGTPIQIAAGQVVTGVDFVAFEGGTITGGVDCGGWSNACGDLNATGAIEVRWKSNLTSRWEVIHSYPGDRQDPMHMRWYYMAPGTYRVFWPGGFGWAPFTSPVIALPENGSATAGPAYRKIEGLGVRDGNGNLLRYGSNLIGGIDPVKKEASGYAAYTVLADVGDITGDSVRDILGITASGSLNRISGKEGGGYSAAKTIATGWQNYTKIVPLGDDDGDGNSEIVAVGRSGTAYLLRGDGRGGFGARTAIGASGQWSSYVHLAAIGRLEGESRPSILAVSKTGKVFVFRSIHALFDQRTQVAGGWSDRTQVVGVGAFDADMNGDLVYRLSNGDVYLQSLNGSGVPTKAKKIGSHWSKRLLF